MLIDKDISIHLSCQQFECNTFEINETESRLKFTSVQNTEEVECPFCRRNHCCIQDTHKIELRDLPLWIGVRQTVEVELHRYMCNGCGKTFNEENCFKYPGTRITPRAAKWIQELLRCHLPISAVHEITGIHWETIKTIHSEMMNEELNNRRLELRDGGYKPTYLAVDEFAIHKGHRYATCVMDLVEGDVLWVGKGRSKDCFAKFFEDVELKHLSEVKAFAMDMNASYNSLVEYHLPHAEIVYDRYHMQAQFGKDVLGVVRLQEAREHRLQSREFSEAAKQEKDAAERRILKSRAKQQSQLYTSLKSSRWTLLANGDNLSPEKAEKLNEILASHSNLALCYAMKEEMCKLFDLRDSEEARTGWKNWFEGAKASGIPALVKFAELKERRLEGLVAHAKHNISTGKLEGFNNKIKVAKRVGYGYRDEPYFFTLIRYMSIPAVRGAFHKNP